MNDRIERDIVIDAPPERVWDVITQAEHVGTWFADGATVDLRPGGTIVFRWDTHGTQYATIERLDAPRYFSYRWSPGAKDVMPLQGASTLVEFILTPEGGRTRLQVVETGFTYLRLDDAERTKQFESNSNGWEVQLRDLHAYLAGLAA